MKQTASTSTRLPSDFQLNNYTMVCGRGRACFNHIGNRRLGQIVKMYLNRYENPANTKCEKSEIVSDVIRVIESAGGSFVRQGSDGSWHTVRKSAIREKVSSSFRDLLHTQYRSAAKNKNARRAAKNSELKMEQEVKDIQPLPISTLSSPAATVVEPFDAKDKRQCSANKISLWSCSPKLREQLGNIIESDPHEPGSDHVLEFLFAA